MVAEAFEVTAKLCKYVTKITSTKNIIIDRPILGAGTRWPKRPILLSSFL